MLGVLILVTAASLMGGYFWLHHRMAASQPQISGTLTLEGLGEQVEIIRDAYGVPHIYARNETDLYFALGFTVAQDRLWQMEFMRRLGAGRLAEILGEDLLEVDRYFRTITAAHRKVALPGDLTPLFRAFVNGVNAFIATAEGKLPLEFMLLQFKPAPWKFEDIVAVYWVMNWQLSFGWRADPVAFDIYQRVGAERFNRFFPTADAATPTIVADKWDDSLPMVSPLSTIFNRVAEKTGFSPSSASNSWAISGQRTRSGMPILANDTHMGLTNPSLWWEVHLVCPRFEAAGFMVPGLPGLAVGHTPDVAWGITTVMTDDVDFFIERFKAEDQAQYRHGDAWRPVRTIEQKIPVKGRAPEPLTIRLTHNGPVIKTFESEGELRALTARWAVLEAGLPFRAAVQLTRAETIQDVIGTLKHWEAPGQNFIFADRHGNIGYWCCALIPIRANHNGLLPLPGWSDKYEWQGIVPFEERPHMINPPGGFIASANNRVAGGDYPYEIGTYHDAPDRFLRIHHLFADQADISVQDVRRAQADIYAPLASELVPLILEAVSQNELDEGMKTVMKILSAWDFRMDKESAAASIYEMAMNQLLRNLMAEELGPDLFEKYIGLSVFPPRALRRLIKARDAMPGKGTGVSAGGLSDDVIAQSLQQAVAKLRDTFGDDPDRWRWGKLHTLTFEHVLGKRKPLNRFFNIGPFAVSGSTLTVNKKKYSYAHPFTVKEGAAQRMIVDLAHPEAALHVLPTGQSGLKGSPHYEDQLALYLNNAYRAFKMRRDALEAEKTGLLMLIPPK